MKEDDISIGQSVRVLVQSSSFRKGDVAKVCKYRVAIDGVIEVTVIDRERGLLATMPSNQLALVEDRRKIEKTVLYARDGDEMVMMTDFAATRNYIPDQVAIGALQSVVETLSKGDTLILHTMKSLDQGHYFGFSVPALELLERGVTVVTVEENFVLKDDLGSRILVGASSIASEIQKSQTAAQPLAITSPDTVATDEDKSS